MDAVTPTPESQHLDRKSLRLVIGAQADFQALAQDRPYRKALAPRQILAVLDGIVKAGRLDGALVRILAEDMELSWGLARVGEPAVAPAAA